MSRAQQSSIRSFFQPRRPEYAAPPSTTTTTPPQNTNVAAQIPSPAPPPPAPPLPLTGHTEPVTIPIMLPPNGVPVLPSPPSLPSGASIVPLAEQHIPALRRINTLLLPVLYPDSFYANILDPLASGLFSRVILWQDSEADAPKVIGGLVCRLEPNPFLDAQGQPLPHPCPPSHPQRPANTTPFNTPYHAVYIQSLALLSPYRSLGLAAAALEHIVASAVLLPAAGCSIDARTIYAHVWTKNDGGLKWYEARGFAREGREPVTGYYFKLRPDSAWIVHRHIGGGGGGGLGANSHASSSSDTNNHMAASAAPNAPPPGGDVLAAAINLLPPSPPPPSSAAAATTSGAPPPPRSNSNRPSAVPSPAPSTTSSLSFQNARPETEWNDLPAEMVSSSSTGPGTATGGQLLSPNNNNGSTTSSAGAAKPASAASSRSSSAAARKRKERAYPSAAFGH
ncbi:hypothetical protein C8A00DRAFT_34164 [Chaetomidium leptoderma]|uniref:N-acetyltransferase domain-containing protein n=1 Tax=Chaetomidium leptoderma TaxID=669021 RepID=A0AAN6ZW52_9PEZI|nr:hypothetical protein C8A00DRAFT_34164 [Chaetomidium leptoderma]